MSSLSRLSDDLIICVADKKEPELTKAVKLVDEIALETKQAELRRALQKTYTTYNEPVRQPTSTSFRQSPSNCNATSNTQQDYRHRGKSGWNQNKNRPFCYYCMKTGHSYSYNKAKNSNDYVEDKRSEPDNTSMIKQEEGKLYITTNQSNGVPVGIRRYGSSAIIDTGSKNSLINSKISDKLHITTSIPQSKKLKRTN
jgi:hypothetical protein